MILAALLALAAPAPIVALPPSTRPLLQARTPVALALVTELNSETAKQGDRFELEVAEDVKAGPRTAIPKGARAYGEVVRQSGKGGFGRAGNLEVRLLHVMLGDRIVRLDGSREEQGANRQGVAIATGVVAGAFGLLIKGKHASIPAGTRMTGYTYRDLPLGD
jgi:hypothetical protein